MKNIENNTNISVRVKQLIGNEGISINKFSASVGASNSYFNKIIKNGSTLGSDMIEKILRTYPHISSDWLLLGDGEMYRTTKEEGCDDLGSGGAEHFRNFILNIDKERTKDIGVPYFNIDIEILFQHGFQGLTPEFYINSPPFNDSTCWINFSGDSMKGDTEKSIAPNSIIALKYKPDWGEFTLMNENYGIVTEKFSTIKMLGEGRNDDYFKMIPLNKNYSSQQLPKSMIQHLFEVKGSMKQF